MEKLETATEDVSKQGKSRFASIRILLRNRLFLVFLLGDILICLAFEIIDYPVIVYLLRLGFDVVAIGQLTSAGLIVALISQIPAGILTDRIGRKNGIMLGLCIYSVFPIFYPLGNTYILFLAIAVLSGVAHAILLTASFALVGEIVSKQSIASATTLVMFVGGVLTISPFVGVALYLINEALPFVICSIMTVVSICIFHRYIKPSKEQKTVRYKERMKNRARDLTKTFKRSLIGISIANLAWSFGTGILSLLGFLYIVDVIGESLMLAGLALIIPQIVSLVLSLFIAQWMDKIRRWKTFLTLGLLGYGGAALAFTFVTRASEAILVWTCLAVMGVIIGSSASTIVIETSEEATKGTAISVYSFFGKAGLIISLQLAGYLQKAYGSFQKPFFLVALSCVLAVVIAWTIIKEKPFHERT